MAVENKQTVVLGNFDGLHRGHQQLLRLGKSVADKHGERLAVFTFHPQLQELQDPTFCYLRTVKDKEKRMKAMGVDIVQTVPFEKSIAKLSPEEFVQQILVEKLHAAHVVVGFNYSFGYRGVGTPERLRDLCAENGIEVVVMDAYYLDGEIVSSSTVRKYLQAGNMEKVNAMLGEIYTIEGKVIYGNQIGRTIGFPTANIAVEEKLLLPARGVYATQTQIDGTSYLGFLNIGLRPTIGTDQGINIEVHLFDFHGDLYGKTIRTRLYTFLRPEQKFSGLEALKQQLEQDKMQVTAFFASTKI